MGVLRPQLGVTAMKRKFTDPIGPGAFDLRHAATDHGRARAVAAAKRG